MDQDFEWDEAKDQTNRSKHGIGFDLAIQVFIDPDRVTRRDLRVDYGEGRFITVGFIQKSLFVVVYTMRGQAIRIISARKANTRERRRHDDRPKNA